VSDNYCTSKLIIYKNMTKKLNIEYIREVAKNKGIKLLSNEYINNHTKLKFKCKNGHVWETTWKIITKGGFCPTCYWGNPHPPFKYQGSYKEKRLKEVKKIIKKRGGECLSDKYKDNFSSLLFKCEKGHEWKSNFKSVIIKGSWCPICLKEDQLSIENLKKIAKLRGGSCLSETRGQKKLEWKCHFGHTWMASVGNVVNRNSWCPECASGLYENICRLYFEELFGKSFVKSHPKWLKNRSGKQLELDGYCVELKLAFEHNGRQHYIANTIYANSNIEQNDLDKKKLCDEYGICLIIIPELFFYTKIEKLRKLIINKCETDNINIPFPYKKIDYKKAHFINKNKEYLNEAKNIAFKKGGRCLSNIYISSSHKLIFMCKKDHTWKTTLVGIRKGWCPKCSVYVHETNTIQDARKLAELKNGECLSDKYINNHTKMVWKCKLGHVWNSTYNNIQMDKWCPQCSIKLRSNKKRLTIEIYQEVAKNKGGQCLSTEYKSCYEKLIWKCNEGHIWKARADQIKNTDRWCPICSKLKRKRK